MREPENIRAVEALQPDWMGFICWPKSSRYVDDTPNYLPTKCQRVGVFVDAELPFIINKIDQLGLHRIQLHGKETPDFCKEVHQATGLPVIKAISVLTVDDIAHAESYADSVTHLLFDTKCKCVGGSGEQFDWDILQHYHGTAPFLLAGGIGPQDAERIKAFTHPQFAGVDLNSRFEVSPAVKDAALLSTFIEEIKRLKI